MKNGFMRLMVNSGVTVMAYVKELRVWHMGIQIVGEIRELVDSLPRNGVGDLKNQMVRAAISIPSNVAEGAGRESDQEFRRFLRIAMGSCQELETQIEIVRSLGIGDREIVDSLVECVDHEGRMLRCLLRRL